MTAQIVFNFENKVYKVNPGFDLVSEVEDELGSLSELLEEFSNNKWSVSDLTVLIHILLQAADRTVDFVELGDCMIKDGLDKYLNTAKDFLKLVLNLK